VAARNVLQWFYDWTAIEREVQRRRKERPDDPTILLEAGEMYLRGGGETERARSAFREALRVARASSPAHVERAVRGLYMTWITEGDQAAEREQTARAVAAYESALEHAQSPEDHVRARLRIHRALDDDAPARIRNLAAMVETAEGARAVFDPDEGEVRARAAALFLLADAYVASGRPTEAINALQCVLREERDAEFSEGTGHERASRGIAAILEKEGRLPYRRHERKARDLLARATKEDDPALLDRLLDEYPNAAVVPEALLERGRALLAEGRAMDAARYLRRMLAEAPGHVLAPAALAGLARAYRAWGALGASRFALARIEIQHARDRFRWDGRTWSGAEFVAAERALLGGGSDGDRPIPTLRAPLREVSFEPVGDEEYARQVTVVTDETGPDGPAPCPLALMMRGRTLVAIDLRRGRVAWDAPTGSCYRAVYAQGKLVVAVSRELRGLDADTGEDAWSYEHGASVRELHIAHGQVFALLQDTTGLAGRHRLVALDAFRGHVLWSVDLGREEYRKLRPWRDRVLLQHVPMRGSRTVNEMLVFDGFSGARRGRITIPLMIERTPAIVGSLYCVAGRTGANRKRVLAAFDLETARPKWQRALEGDQAVTSLAADGNRLLVLRNDGTLVTYGTRDGRAQHHTRIFVGDAGRASPFPGTELLVDPKRVTLFPWIRRPALSVVTYDRRTGKLVWEAPYETDVHPAKAALLDRGEVICSMISYPRDRVQHILIRLIDAASGKVLQEIEPEGLSKANWIPTMADGYGTLVVFGKTGASIFRSEDADAKGR
jgi:outer membrane protein assembly factor BamB/tetratricopeptide (TPR) repeat protein